VDVDHHRAVSHLLTSRVWLVGVLVAPLLPIFSVSVQRPGEYVLLITFAISMTDKSLIMQATQKILKWIQKEAPNLFI
jgi:hypothetical protein